MNHQFQTTSAIKAVVEAAKMAHHDAPSLFYINIVETAGSSLSSTCEWKHGISQSVFDWEKIVIDGGHGAAKIIKGVKWLFQRQHFLDLTQCLHHGLVRKPPRDKLQTKWRPREMLWLIYERVQEKQRDCETRSHPVASSMSASLIQVRLPVSFASRAGSENRPVGNTAAG